MTISAKGQIIIPAEIRAADSIRAGDTFDIIKVRKGEYLVRRVEEAPNKGLVDWLLSCPAKGFFEPIDSDGTEKI
jgi:AbrB family looped-hinge helix DNA binding protein